MLQNRLKNLFSSHNTMMLICCAAMAVGFFAIIGRGGSTLSALAPLAICVGAHLIMHKVMGKSCHGSEEADKESTAAAEIKNPGPKLIPFHSK
ncbi:MAG: DUF2933 domain-containing protein [Alphaproteobacteria bacterium]|nr:DUF2933 domain-containing protein [Rhodospirillales bacterium]MCW9046253.1 DUF2933 domain-containing protein [Alphaproteobacteria bacterium]